MSSKVQSPSSKVVNLEPSTAAPRTTYRLHIYRPSSSTPNRDRSPSKRPRGIGNGAPFVTLPDRGRSEKSVYAGKDVPNRLTQLGWKVLAIHQIIAYRVYRMEVIGMGRTNVVLDDELVAGCQKATGISTRRGLIHHALSELLRHERQKKILELKGTVRWQGNLGEWRRGRR